jgi:hypothetical protein
MNDPAAVAQTLAAHVVMSTPTAETWYRVAHGELSPEQAEALLREGAEAGAVEREAIERAKRVFVPPSAEQQQAGLEALLARRAAEDVETGAGAVVVPLRPRRARRWVVGMLAVAAAVVLTVWLVPPRPGRDLGPFAGGYEIELENGAAVMRGTGPRAEIPTFLLGDELRIRLVPEEAVEAPLGIVVFAMDRSGRSHRVDVEPRLHARGVVELATTVKALGLDEGEWELVIAIGWVEALPASWDELAERGGPESAGYEVARQRVRVVARL